MTNTTATVKKAPGGRWRVYQGETVLGTAWNNGARRVAGRNWSWRAADGATGKAASRASCVESLERHAKGTKA